jgi:hypothetical protein
VAATALGVPLMLPSVVLKVSPAGSAEFMDHLVTVPPLLVGVTCAAICVVSVKFVVP